MKRSILFALIASFTTTVSAADMVTPADMSSEAQDKMYSHITEYNGCMMQNRLQTSQSGQDAQGEAQKILQSCESHLDNLKAHLAANNVDASLTEGMTKKLRSKAARQLMTKTMNNLAAQAAAMQNAQKVNAQQ